MADNGAKSSRSEWFLRGVELGVVAVVAISALFVFLLGLAWIVFGIGEAQKNRLVKAAGGINVSWKLGLLLLIPLFYRTVREVLERMEEGPLGTKFPRPKTPTPGAEAIIDEEEARQPSEGKK